MRVLTMWRSITLCAALAYLVLCRWLRSRRLRYIRSRYNYPNRASFSKMTHTDAQAIVQNVADYDFPYTYALSAKTLIPKSYAIVSIAELLVGVSDLTRFEDLSKRFEDTGILFKCTFGYPPDSPLLHRAIARMNYLHAPYVRSGKILNSDMLWYLWVLLVEPIDLLNRYEWRPLCEMEIAAFGTFFKNLGDMMEIDYLEQLGRNSWADGIDFLEDLTLWANKYEAAAMRPSPEGLRLTQLFLRGVLTSYPWYLRWPVYQMLLCTLNKKWLVPLGLPEPNIWAAAILKNLYILRGKFVLYLLPPRREPFAHRSDPNPETGRIHSQVYYVAPWYIPVTFWSRWGPTAWLTWAAGGQLPGDRDSKMLHEGFLFEDIGPLRKRGKGQEEMARMEAKIRELATSNRPFAAEAEA